VCSLTGINPDANANSGVRARPQLLVLAPTEVQRSRATDRTAFDAFIDSPRFGISVAAQARLFW
jgi:hypothetical protein